jgi:hypothetical protein
MQNGILLGKIVNCQLWWFMPVIQATTAAKTGGDKFEASLSKITRILSQERNKAKELETWLKW